MRARIRELARDESGLTMIEILASLAIMIVVLSATLTTLTSFQKNARQTDLQNESQTRARIATATLARELRNLASPTPSQPQAVEKAESYDLVFQTVDPEGPNAGDNASNVRRMRYCLDATKHDDGRLWVQWQTWTDATPPPAPATLSCPDPAWPGKKVVAEEVTNRISGRGAPVWLYNSETPSEISSIRTSLYVDVNPGARPEETRLTTGIFLRNQNRAPTAAFSATLAGSGHVLLNGWGAQDPEGDTLRYVWYSGATEIGTGITFDWTPPGPGSYELRLKVLDSAGLEAEAPAQVVNVS